MTLLDEKKVHRDSNRPLENAIDSVYPLLDLYFEGRAAEDTGLVRLGLL